jgi:CelD/BcsL family acetyltransferase involved in cellulose biosynthesis
MRVRVISAGELTRDLRDAWTNIQRSRAELSSPYFTPGFVEAAAHCSDGVRIGVLEDGGRPTGFFPFELRTFGVAQPVGGRMSDFQGVIAEPGCDWRAAELVAGCGLRMWKFDHLLTGQTEFAGFVEATRGSPALDLRSGFDGYHAGRKADGSKHIDRLLYKSRRMRRQLGEVHFEFDSRDLSVLAQIIEWKRAQCRRTGVVDFLAERRNADLLRTIFETRTEGFAWIMSVLRVGERIAAAHFGMRTHDTLHYWFPAYETALGKHSPGEILLAEMIRAAAESGLVHLDLGKGDDQYKEKFCTHMIPVAEGAVAVSRPMAVLRRVHQLTMRFLRTSTIAAPVRALRRLQRNLRSHVPPESPPESTPEPDGGAR